MPDKQTVTQPLAFSVSAPLVAPRRRRTTSRRVTLLDVLARRRDIEALLQIPGAKNRHGERTAMSPAAALSRNFPQLFSSLRAEKLYLRLAAHLPADGSPRTFPLWRIQAWAGNCAERTAKTLIRELTLTGVLPLIRHQPGREGRSGSYSFVRQPVELLAQQHRERQGIIDRREQLRCNRMRRRAEGSTAEACCRVSFNANWMTRPTCTADERAALDLAFPAPATQTAFMALPSQLRARWGDWKPESGWGERWTPAKFDRHVTVTTVRREPPLIGSGQSFADAKAAALARLERLKATL